MKIEDKDIIRTAHQLREEQNVQLHVRPWNRHRHFHVPAWLVAVPAAAIIGFVLGIWTNDNRPKETQLTAFVDTVYIKVPEKVKEPNTIVQTDIKQKEAPTIKPKQATSSARHIRPTTVGHSIADDKIRYDLLVRD
ncbi:MAG: hypothetical protein IKQ05_03310 [Prevotella sp.]|nr:hypothetical protein [Prevotella sp.]